MQPKKTHHRAPSWLPALPLLAGAALLVVGAQSVLATQAGGPPAGGRPLSAEEQKRVNEAIQRGVAYLGRTQLGNGSWSTGTLPQRGAGLDARKWAVGYAALPGLTLLECGVPPADPAVQKAARVVRQHIQAQTRTYEIALAILFLDRLGEPEDRKLIRSLALRLAAGQTAHGGWWYDCPLLKPAQEQKLLQYLGKQKGEMNSKQAPQPPAKGAKAPTQHHEDNSNTQFALLALWAARRYDLPLEYTVARAEQRFRASQHQGGWYYVRSRMRPYGSMTCAGLLGLAVGRGWGPEAQAGGKGPDQPRAEDEGITKGLRALAPLLDDPSDSGAQKLLTESEVKKGAVNLYFLWSVERVGVLYNLRTIGGKDWYRWGAALLLPAQNADGSWFTKGYLGATPTIDTCFALLFLKRADLLPGLSKQLQLRLAITDPGPASPGESEKKSPGKQPAPKLKEAIPDPGKESPGQRPAPGEADDKLLQVDLGEVQAGATTERRFVVRGPAPFRITKIEGTDEEFAVQADAAAREAHTLTVTLRPKETGVLRRTLRLRTDLPGRADVAATVTCRAAPPK
jgi:hypothetical protein